MLLVDLVPYLLAVRRIAFFGGNVYILYEIEMIRNVWILTLCRKLILLDFKALLLFI